MRKLGKFIKSLVILIVVVGVVLAYWTGIFSWEDTRSRALGVVGNVGAAVGRAGPGDLSPEKPAQSAVACATTCRQNLQLLQSIKKKLESRSGIAQGTLSWNDVSKEMHGKARPACPCGGEYALGTLEENVSCSIGANGTSDRSDDHSLRNF